MYDSDEARKIATSSKIIWGVGNLELPFAFLSNIDDAKIVAAQFNTNIFPFVVYSSADAYLAARASWLTR